MLILVMEPVYILALPCNFFALQFYQVFVIRYLSFILSDIGLCIIDFFVAFVLIFLQIFQIIFKILKLVSPHVKKLHFNACFFQILLHL